MNDIIEALKDKSFEELRDYYSGQQPNSRVGHYSQVEFLYRQTVAIINQSEAAISTSESMRKDSRKMTWSLFFIAISAIATLLIAISNSLRG